jgi:hypothetical protein
MLTSMRFDPRQNAPAAVADVAVVNGGSVAALCLPETEPQGSTRW